jgi:FKBP-type peptidyl-prolyl cis-trans isomerase SlyD
MNIGKDTVVSIDYTLKDDGGDILDSSDDGAPLEYLHGHSQIVPGLERALEGKAQGAEVKIAVPPGDGYGDVESGKVMDVERKELPEDLTPEVGMQLAAEDNNGRRVPVWITKVTSDKVTLDGNHPLAGKTLHFEVAVRSVRKATKEELKHGHAHGADGHHH